MAGLLVCLIIISFNLSMKRLGMDEFIIDEKLNVIFTGVEVGLELINKDVPLLMFDFSFHICPHYTSTSKVVS